MTRIRSQETEFYSNGVRCSAVMHAPPGGDSHAAVVLGYGFGAIRRMTSGNFAKRFAEAGFIAVEFDYRGWGDSDGEPRQVFSIPDQLEDWRNAIEFVRSQPRVDIDRVALWGSSMAGAHVQTLAARDHSIAAVIAQVPLCDAAAAAMAGGLPYMLRGMAAGLRDLGRRAAGTPPFRINIFGPPGSTAVMANTQAVEGYKSLLPPEHEWTRFGWQNEVPATSMLTLPMYRPGRRANRITCPVLYQIADQDTVTPIRPALLAAKRALHSELLRYPTGHFGLYQSGPLFEQAVTAQIDFLRRHLREAPPSHRQASANELKVGE